MLLTWEGGAGLPRRRLETPNTKGGLFLGKPVDKKAGMHVITSLTTGCLRLT